MSMHFSAEQYDGVYRPRDLGNWQLPRHHRGHPRVQEGYTQSVATDRGHLQPGVRRTVNCPWGKYVGTWDMPIKLPGPRIHEAMARSAKGHSKYLQEKADAEYILSGSEKSMRFRRPGAEVELPECYPMRRSRTILQDNLVERNARRSPPNQEYRQSPPINQTPPLDEALKPLSPQRRTDSRIVETPTVPLPDISGGVHPNGQCCAVCARGESCVTCGCAGRGARGSGRAAASPVVDTARPAGYYEPAGRQKTPLMIEDDFVPNRRASACAVCASGNPCNTCGCNLPEQPMYN